MKKPRTTARALTDAARHLARAAKELARAAKHYQADLGETTGRLLSPDRTLLDEETRLAAIERNISKALVPYIENQTHECASALRDALAGLSSFRRAKRE